MGLTHFTCDAAGVSGTTEVHYREIPGGWEARVGIALLGRANLTPEQLRLLSPFDPKFHDNYAMGRGSTKGLALAALRRDVALTADTLQV